MGLHQGALLLPQGTHQRTHSICVYTHHSPATGVLSYTCTHTAALRKHGTGVRKMEMFISFRLKEVVGTRPPPSEHQLSHAYSLNSGLAFLSKQPLTKVGEHSSC